MALLRQSVRDASTQVLPSPAGHPGDAQNARPGRRKGPRASGLARRRLPGHAFPRSALTRQPADGAHNAHPPLPPPIQNVHGASSAVAASESGGKKHLGLRHGHRHVPEATRTHLAFASRWNHPFLFPLKSPSVCSGARRLTRFSGLKAVFGQITHTTCRLENTPDLQEGFACRAT